MYTIRHPSRNQQKHKAYVLVSVLLIIFLTVTLAPTAYAHGTEIDLNEVEAIEIQAHFDNGDPMPNAQVTIYAPTDRANPWLSGEADGDGYFVFVPDRAMAGQWDIQIRTAGHGDWVYIDIAEGAIAELKGSSNGVTTAQIVMMSAAVIWGFVGTALYFSRPKETSQAREEEPVMVS